MLFFDHPHTLIQQSTICNLLWCSICIQNMHLQSVLAETCQATGRDGPVDYCSGPQSNGRAPPSCSGYPQIQVSWCSNALCFHCYICRPTLSNSQSTKSSLPWCQCCTCSSISGKISHLCCQCPNEKGPCKRAAIRGSWAPRHIPKLEKYYEKVSIQQKSCTNIASSLYDSIWDVSDSFLLVSSTASTPSIWSRTVAAIQEDWSTCHGSQEWLGLWQENTRI